MGILPVGLSVAWMCREGIPCGGGLLRYPVCHILSLDVYTYSFHVIKCMHLHDDTAHEYLPVIVYMWYPWYT